MIRMTTSRIRRAIGVTSLTASLVVSMGAVASFADQAPAEPFDVREFDSDPQPWDGNPECSFFTGDGETTFTEITKFDPAAGETGDVLSQDGITVTITDDKGDDEALRFDWDSGEIEVTMVIVKASAAANLYVYDPPATSGEGLLTVEDHGISHITFCAGNIDDEEEEEEEPDPTIAPTASAVGSCTGGVDVTLDNTGTDDDDAENVYTTTYTVVVTVNGDEVHNGTHDVVEGQSTTIDATPALGHGKIWEVDVSAVGMDPYSTGGTTSCPGGPDPDPDPDPAAAPAAAFNHACSADDAGVATVTLTNTGDADAEFTIVRGLVAAGHTQSASLAQKVTVAPGGTHVESVPLAGSEVVDFVITSGDDEWRFAADNDLCVTEVQGVVLENDPPTPNGSANPAPQPEVQGVQLAATGLESPDLLLLAMLFAGLGLALLLSTSKPDPLVVRTH